MVESGSLIGGETIKIRGLHTREGESPVVRIVKRSIHIDTGDGGEVSLRILKHAESWSKFAIIQFYGTTIDCEGKCETFCIHDISQKDNRGIHSRKNSCGDDRLYLFCDKCLVAAFCERICFHQNLGIRFWINVQERGWIIACCCVVKIVNLLVIYEISNNGDGITELSSAIGRVFGKNLRKLSFSRGTHHFGAIKIATCKRFEDTYTIGRRFFE